MSCCYETKGDVGCDASVRVKIMEVFESGMEVEDGVWKVNCLVSAHKNFPSGMEVLTKCLQTELRLNFIK